MADRDHLTDPKRKLDPFLLVPVVPMKVAASRSRRLPRRLNATLVKDCKLLEPNVSPLQFILLPIRTHEQSHFQPSRSVAQLTTLDECRQRKIAVTKARSRSRLEPACVPETGQREPAVKNFTSSNRTVHPCPQKKGKTLPPPQVASNAHAALPLLYSRRSTTQRLHVRSNDRSLKSPTPKDRKQRSATTAVARLDADASKC